MAAESLIFDELRTKLGVEETQEITERELAALKGHKGIERDKDAVLEHYAALAPGASTTAPPRSATTAHGPHTVSVAGKRKPAPSRTVVAFNPSWRGVFVELHRTCKRGASDKVLASKIPSFSQPVLNRKIGALGVIVGG